MTLGLFSKPETRDTSIAMPPGAKYLYGSIPQFHPNCTSFDPTIVENMGFKNGVFQRYQSLKELS